MGCETLISCDPLYWKYAPSSRVRARSGPWFCVTWAIAQTVRRHVLHPARRSRHSVWPAAGGRSRGSSRAAPGKRPGETGRRLQRLGISSVGAQAARRQSRFPGSGVFENQHAGGEHQAPNAARDLLQRRCCLVGFVRNSDVLEIASLDPKQGVQLYVLVNADQPAFAQSHGCLRCHQGAVTLGVPGLLVSSVHPISQTPVGTRPRLHDGPSHVL